jgi:hypothetical protein
MSKLSKTLWLIIYRSIKSLAKRDESFNEFLKNFKAKNEQGWASIVDLTQEE